MLSAAEIAELRAEHFAYGAECAKCEDAWPCPTTRTLDVLETNRRLRREFVEALIFGFERLTYREIAEALWEGLERRDTSWTFDSSSPQGLLTLALCSLATRAL